MSAPGAGLRPGPPPVEEPGSGPSLLEGRARRLALAVAAVSAAVIGFQIVVMQLLAAAQWQYFAALVISIALLGNGAAGTAVVLWRRPLRRLAMAGSVRLAGVVGRFDTYLLFLDPLQLALLAGAIGVYALPFFLAGLALTLAFDREVGRIGTLYGASLAGSAAGAAGVLALLWLLPPAALAGVLALLPLLAAWWLRPALAPGRLGAAAAAALAVPAAAIVWPAQPLPSQYKPIHAARLLPDARIVHGAHSPYGRLEVVRAPALRHAPGLSLRYPHEPPVRDVAFVDGQAFGTLLGREEPGAEHVLDHTTQALPYALRRPESVLVLDAATGADVSHALAQGARRVTAVEPNLAAVRLLRDRHPEWIDGLYRDPAVRVVVASARAWLGRDDGERHDLVVLPVLGSFGGGSGAQALRERYELTLEAFDAIWRRLADDGLLVLTVWDDQPPRLTLRALATLREGLKRQGIDDIRAHLAAVRSWGTMSFVVGTRPWSPRQVQAIRGFAAERGFDPLLLPGIDAAARDRFNRLADRSFLDRVDAIADGGGAREQSKLFDLRPTSDDRPYFEHFIRPSAWRELIATFGARELPYLEIGWVFALASFVQVTIAALLLIVAPLLRVGWKGTRRRWTLLYFAGTGIGFMAFEIVLMQRLTLLLGHPVFAAAAVLTALLLGSGLGSLVSSRIVPTPRRLAAIGSAVAALIVAYAGLLPPAADAAMGWPLAAKAVLVLALLAPPAFLMGMMFPLGLRRLAGSDDTHVAWACGIDHSLSVAAAAGAALLAAEAGFGAVMLGAALAYAAVAVGGGRLGRGG